MEKLLLAMIVFSIILSSCSAGQVEIMPSYGNEVSDFEVTDQNDEAFKRSDMDGKVWLVNFIFTNCKTVCPPMTMNLTETAKELEDENVKNYGILSFTVDPEEDTPEVIADYIGWFDIPEETEWHLVTGYSPDVIKRFAKANFKTNVDPPKAGEDQATHSTALYLVDAEGTIIKHYSGIDFGDDSYPIEEVVNDVKTLAPR
ncbi:SCO family protein [Corticicoccus populi]|uniref:SCO family protein n=1 Tax=Corticicoccus populi TaxID=1812821 RepID=A0ABW5WXJ8_9STAP